MAGNVIDGIISDIDAKHVKRTNVPLFIVVSPNMEIFDSGESCCFIYHF